MNTNPHYPKPNVDELHTIYKFELTLIENISKGDKDNAFKTYDDFFLKEDFYKIMDGNEIRAIKNYIISLTLLICHSVIRKGLSPYSGQATYRVFTKSIENSNSKAEVLKWGRKMVLCYSTQIIRNLVKIDNTSIRSAIDYINNNLGEPLSLEDISNHVGLSKCYFCTQFKKETQMSFTEYLTYTRIEKSKFLLSNSSKSILDIAILMGFNSQSYFSTQFKRHTNMTPKEFRDRRGNASHIL